MGRPSKLTDAQWERIGKRILAGESAASLAREFGISKASISKRVSKRVESVKDVANQIVATEAAMGLLNVSEQMAARSLADELKAISGHLASAARYGATTSHRLAGLASSRLEDIPDGPLSDDSRKIVTEVVALTRASNESSEIGVNLLRANKEAVERLGRTPATSDLPDDVLSTRIAELSKKYGVGV